MKIPDEILTIWLEIMNTEELIRFRKRLQMNAMKIDWNPEKQQALAAMFSAELERREKKE